MNILAFDTTASTLSVAVLADKKVLAKRTILEAGKQSELLIPTIEDVLKQAGLSYQDLNLIAATKGPGSFTGVRIGLTAAKTLKLATGLSLILLTSNEVLAFKYRRKIGRIFTVLDARMDEFFCAEFESDGENFRSLENGSEPELVKFDDIIKKIPQQNFFLCGSGKKIISEILQKTKLSFEVSDESDVIDAEFVGLLASEKLLNGSNSLPNSDPVYLREPRIGS